jgi:hypothetical protein
MHIMRGFFSSRIKPVVPVPSPVEEAALQQEELIPAGGTVSE